MLSSDNAYESINNNTEMTVQKLLEPTHAAAANMPATAAVSYSQYEAIAKPLWKRYTGGSGVLRTTENTAVPKDPSKVFAESGTDRLSVILPYRIKKIVVFPPIKGVLAKFKTYMNDAFTSSKEAMSDDTCYIFTCPFFGDDTPQNRALFTYFMQVKLLIQAGEKTNRLYILTEFSPEHTEKSRNILEGKDSNTLIYPLLEPSYIVYPYGIDIKTLNSEGQARTDIPNDSCRGLLFSAAAVNEADLPKADSSMDGLLAVLQKDVFDTKAVKNDVISSVAYKADSIRTDPALDGMNFRVVLGREVDSSTYSIYKRGEPRPQAKSELDGFSSIFLENSDAYVEDVPLVPVELGTEEFLLRSPLPQVREDWKNAIFTREESNFLNTLNINPERLSLIFGESWKEKLQVNLAIIARSKCFKDSSLLLHVECQETQGFIAKIFNNFVENAEDILDEEKNQMQSTIANLTAQVIQQKNGSTTGGGDLYTKTVFEGAFFPTGNPNKYKFEKNPNANIKTHVMPGYIFPNQCSIDTLVVDVEFKKHYKSRLTMNMTTAGTSPTEKEIGNARNEITAIYRRMKKETENPKSKFPRFQIILPE